MYARQSAPIGLSGLLDTIRDVTAAGAMTFLQIKQQKSEAKAQEAAMERESQMRAWDFQRMMSSPGGTGMLGGMTMPIIIGVGALGLFFFMRK